MPAQGLHYAVSVLNSRHPDLLLMGHAVNASELTFVHDSGNVTISVQGSSGTRRLLQSGLMDLPQRSPGAHATGQQRLFQHASRRQLLQVNADAGQYDIQVTITKCNGQYPVTNASAQALLTSGLITALDKTVTLMQTAPGSNVYTTTVNLADEQQFPNLQLDIQATVSFCNTNQAAINKACSGGYPGGVTNPLLSACEAFETASLPVSIPAEVRRALLLHHALLCQNVCSADQKLPRASNGPASWPSTGSHCCLARDPFSLRAALPMRKHA